MFFQQTKKKYKQIPSGKWALIGRLVKTCFKEPSLFIGLVSLKHSKGFYRGTELLAKVPSVKQI